MALFSWTETESRILSLGITQSRLCQCKKGNRSFPKNEWTILLNCVQEPVCIGVQMKMVLPISLLSFPPGRRPLRAGGQGLPQSSIGGKWHRPSVSPVEFRSADPPKAGFNRAGHSEETSTKGQEGRLRNNEHLSNLSSRISALRGHA